MYKSIQKQFFGSLAHGLFFFLLFFISPSNNQHVFKLRGRGRSETFVLAFASMIRLWLV